MAISQVEMEAKSLGMVVVTILQESYEKAGLFVTVISVRTTGRGREGTQSVSIA